MKISPLNIQDPWATRVVDADGSVAHALGAVPVDITVRMDQIDVLHHGYDRNYRPFLHLSAQLESVKAPTVTLPYGIEELEYERGEGPRVDAFYEFDNEQLSVLVNKGYFSGDFAVPDTLTGIPWVFPAEANMVVVSPTEKTDPPLVFLGLPQRAQLRFDLPTSGYELSQYFPDYAPENQLSPLQEELKREGEANSMTVFRGRLQDLFKDVPLDPYDPARSYEYSDGGVQVETKTPDRVFDALVKEAERAIEQRRAVLRETLNATPTTPEAFYEKTMRDQDEQDVQPDEVVADMIDVALTVPSESERAQIEDERLSRESLRRQAREDAQAAADEIAPHAPHVPENRPVINDIFEGQAPDVTEGPELG